MLVSNQYIVWKILGQVLFSFIGLENHFISYHLAQLVLSPRAANAAIDTVSSLVNPTPEGDWNSVCVASDGSYGSEEGLITSFPVRSDGTNWSIAQGVPINDFAREKIDASVTELSEERSMVRDLLPD